MLNLENLRLKENEAKKVKQTLVKIGLSILTTMWTIGVIMIIFDFVQWILASQIRITIAISSLSVFVGTKLFKTLKI